MSRDLKHNQHHVFNVGYAYCQHRFLGAPSRG